MQAIDEKRRTARGPITLRTRALRQFTHRQIPPTAWFVAGSGLIRPGIPAEIV